MKTENQDVKSDSLSEKLSEIKNRCTNCGVCIGECAFLKRYGTPGQIASNYDHSSVAVHLMSFECSLCDLCSAVCPEGLKNIRSMFIEMRREAINCGAAPIAKQGALIRYEQTGMSRLFTLYSLPGKCRKVLFPGCAFAGTRPALTRKVFHMLEAENSGLGIVLDCCGRISEDLGRQDFAMAMLEELENYLVSNGVEDVIAICPNCYGMFKGYANKLNVKMIYEVLPGMQPKKYLKNKNIVIHDPCSMRFDSIFHDMTRQLLSSSGADCRDMNHSRLKTLCCGNGAGVKFISPQLTDDWLERISEEAAESSVLTYCAGCNEMIGSRMNCQHVLDVLLNPEKASGNGLMSKPPFTYLNRLLLKRYLRKTLKADISRERDFREFK